MGIKSCDPFQFGVENLRAQPSRTQDDATVGYSFQRTQSDSDFPVLYGKQPGRWAFGDDSSLESVSHETLSIRLALAARPRLACVAWQSRSLTIVIIAGQGLFAPILSLLP